jgi:hypothetical protein
MRRKNAKSVFHCLQTEKDEKEKKRLMDETMTFHGTFSSGVVRASSTSPPHHQSPLSRRVKKNIALQDGPCFPVEASLSLAKRAE